MRLANQVLPTKPMMPIASVRLLRASLILEEALETIEGLGVEVSANNAEVTLSMDDLFLRDAVAFDADLVAIVDGCCDLMVVTTGTLSACGIGDAEVQAAVDLNNLEKFGPGSSLRDDGKLIKPPGHKPPDLRSLLITQGATL